MNAPNQRPKIVRETLEETLRRLTRVISRMERRHGCTSAEMAEAVACGRIEESAEVAEWLSAYRNSRYLGELAGRETGSPTMATR